jgi:hypothetical protein
MYLRDIRSRIQTTHGSVPASDVNFTSTMIHHGYEHYDGRLDRECVILALYMICSQQNGYRANCKT